MSTSTTTQILGGTVHELLQAYNVHHTGHEEQTPPAPQFHDPQAEAGVHTSEQQEEAQSSVQRHDHQPPELTTRRRVPVYRATSRDHALSSRPAGLNYVESLVVVTLFLGVDVIGVSSCVLQSVFEFCLLMRGSNRM